MPLPKLKPHFCESSRSKRKLEGSSNTAGSMFAAPRNTSTWSPFFRPEPAHLPSAGLATRRGFRCRGASKRNTSCTKSGARRGTSAAVAFAASASVQRRKTMLASALAVVMFTMSCTSSVKASARRRSPPSTPFKMPGRGPSSFCAPRRTSCKDKKYRGTSGSSSGRHHTPVRGLLGGKSTVTSGRRISHAHLGPSLQNICSVPGMLRSMPMKTGRARPAGNSMCLRPMPPNGATNATMASLSAMSSSTRPQSQRAATPPEPSLRRSTPRRASEEAMWIRFAQRTTSPPCSPSSRASVHRSMISCTRSSSLPIASWV
mmetsp:Transcript_10112/g.20730  ORF Transcript_10112/g.20730 Transcript_10112/m.20730 type:complete len:317 (-) Transcript_10112:146-1096(-)